MGGETSSSTSSSLSLSSSASFGEESWCPRLNDLQQTFSTLPPPSPLVDEEEGGEEGGGGGGEEAQDSFSSLDDTNWDFMSRDSSSDEEEPFEAEWQREATQEDPRPPSLQQEQEGLRRRKIRLFNDNANANANNSGYNSQTSTGDLNTWAYPLLFSEGSLTSEEDQWSEDETRPLLMSRYDDEEQEIEEDTVPCKYFEYGCSGNVPSKDYENHLREWQEHHLLLLEEAVALQAETIQDLMSERLPLKSQSYKELQGVSPDEGFSAQDIPQQAPRGLWSLRPMMLDALRYDLARLPTLLTMENLSRFGIWLVEPSVNDRQRTGVRPWHVVYAVVLVFILMCYAFYFGAKGFFLRAEQLLPLLIFLMFSTFHILHAKLVSSLANVFITFYLLVLWMLLNILLLPVF